MKLLLRWLRMASLSELRDQRKERRAAGKPSIAPLASGKDSAGWAFGLTTVASRYTTLLPTTLQSITSAGFPPPHIFLDGRVDEPLLGGYEHTVRDTPVGAFGNWITALWELFITVPFAAKYLIFQDDLLCCKNLFPYLDSCPLPDTQYWNLYTWPHNERKQQGWNESDQMGKGAVALVLPNGFVRALLAHPHIINKPRDPERPRNSVDGAVNAVAKQLGVVELCHSPSLIQHTGNRSTVQRSNLNGERPHPQAISFPGEQFDAMSLSSEQSL